MHVVPNEFVGLEGPAECGQKQWSSGFPLLGLCCVGFAAGVCSLCTGPAGVGSFGWWWWIKWTLLRFFFPKNFFSLVMVCWGHWIWGSCRRWFHKPSCAKIELFQSAEPILIGSKGESVVHRGWKTHLTSLDMSERLDSDIRKLQRLKSPRPPNSISATSDIRCGREVLRKREGAQGAVIAPSFRRWNCFKFQACNQNAVFGWISSTFFCHSWSGGKRIHSGFILECVFTSLVAVTLPYHYHLCFLDVFFPDLPWCVMKQLGEIAAEVVDDAVTTTGISLDALHTAWPSVPGWCWKVSACRWCV